MASNIEIQHLANEIAGLASEVSKNGTSETEQQRNALQAATKKLSFALEAPYETLERLSFVRMNTSVVRIGIDLNLFVHLDQAGPNGLTVEELVRETGVDETLLPRFLRVLVTLGLVSQVGRYCWANTPQAQAVLIPPFKSGFKFLYDFVDPAIFKLPEYLAKNQYRAFTAGDGPFQYAWNTNLSGFDFIMQPQHASSHKDCNIFMEGRRQNAPSWLDFYPFQERILSESDRDANSTIIVDVGGGLGHGLVEVRTRFPNLSGRLILQDLPNTVQQAATNQSAGGFEAMPHSFYDPQPIKGAKVYYIRQVLHDWPNKECHLILENLAAALRPGYSKILINEYIVPEDRISDFLSSCDLVMMGMSGGIERTKKQWDQLVGSAGLRIDCVWTFKDTIESVMEVVIA